MISALQKSWLIDGLFNQEIPTEEAIIRWLQENEYFLSAAVFTDGKGVVHIKIHNIPMSVRDESLLEALYSATYKIAEFVYKQEEMKIEEQEIEEDEKEEASKVVKVEEKLATIIQFPLGGRQVL